MLEREPVRVQELASRAPCRARRRRGRRRPGGRSRPDGRGSGAYGRSRADVQERVGAQQLVDLEVRDRFARRVGVERAARRLVTVAADRRVDPAAPRARMAPDERDVAPLELSLRDELRSRSWASSERATTSRPEVSRSSRWTIPGAPRPRRRSGPRARGRASRRVTGAWMHDDARRLVHDEQVLVLVGDAELDVLGLDLPRRLRWDSTSKLLAALEPVALRRARPSTRTLPLLDEPFGRRARADLGQLGEITVEPRARCLRWNPKRGRREPGAAARVGAAGGAARRAGRARRGR